MAGGVTVGFRRLSSARKFSAAALAAAMLGSILFAQAGNPTKDNPKLDPNAMTRVRIEVTAGASSAPLDMASVYVRYVIKHSMTRDENIEMNIKTNKEGIAIANGIPRGKFLIQVVADGWKAYGQWYDATEDDQSVKIHLERPPKWF